VAEGYTRAEQRAAAWPPSEPLELQAAKQSVLDITARSPGQNAYAATAAATDTSAQVGRVTNMSDSAAAFGDIGRPIHTYNFPAVVVVVAAAAAAAAAATSAAVVGKPRSY
jgi:hypothetical protein